MHYCCVPHVNWVEWDHPHHTLGIRPSTPQPKCTTMCPMLTEHCPWLVAFPVHLRQHCWGAVSASVAA